MKLVLFYLFYVQYQIEMTSMVLALNISIQKYIINWNLDHCFNDSIEPTLYAKAFNYSAGYDTFV